MSAISAGPVEAERESQRTLTDREADEARVQAPDIV